MPHPFTLPGALLLLAIAIIQLISVAGGIPVVRVLLRKVVGGNRLAGMEHAPGSDAPTIPSEPGAESRSPQPAAPPDPADGIGPTEISGDLEELRGGVWIGMMERLGIGLAFIAGTPTLIGVIVAIKGLGRFAEIKESRHASEKFVIGSLASIVWACLWGLATQWIINSFPHW